MPLHWPKKELISNSDVVKKNYNSRQRKIYSDYSVYPTEELVDAVKSKKYVDEVLVIIEDIINERNDKLKSTNQSANWEIKNEAERISSETEMRQKLNINSEKEKQEWKKLPKGLIITCWVIIAIWLIDKFIGIANGYLLAELDFTNPAPLGIMAWVCIVLLVFSEFAKRQGKKH